MIRKLAIEDTSLFSVETAPALIEKMRAEIKAPYFAASISSLGGVERASIMFRISLQPKEEWKNGIFHNSSYGMFALERNGSLEMHTSSGLKKKFRKTVVKNEQDLITKMNKWVEENK